MSIKVLISPPTLVADAVDLQGSSAINVSVGFSAGALSPILESAYYDAWCDKDVYLKVATTSANDVAVSNGYLLRANNTITLAVRGNSYVGAITELSAATLKLHKTWNQNL